MTTATPDVTYIFLLWEFFSNSVYIIVLASSRAANAEIRPPPCGGNVGIRSSPMRGWAGVVMATTISSLPSSCTTITSARGGSLRITSRAFLVICGVIA